MDKKNEKRKQEGHAVPHTSFYEALYRQPALSEPIQQPEPYRRQTVQKEIRRESIARKQSIVESNPTAFTATVSGSKSNSIHFPLLTSKKSAASASAAAASALAVHVEAENDDDDRELLERTVDSILNDEEDTNEVEMKRMKISQGVSLSSIFNREDSSDYRSVGKVEDHVL